VLAKQCRHCGADMADARSCPACGASQRDYQRDGQIIACLVVGLVLLVLILT
jgi:hypothetical protein